MTSEIKKRIADINNGIIPEGYKKTKVGIVPVEWKQVKLGEILKQRKTLMCVSEDAPLLSFTIEEGVIEPTDKKTNKRDFLIKDISTKKFALTEVGDIIYNPANLKFGAIHRNNLRKGVVSPIYGIFYGKQDSVFMGNLLHNQRFIDYAKIYTEGTVEKLKTLKAETFLKLKVVIPLLPEQQKIAEILSAQDKLIELQEKKIEQLKELKKAYLQKMFPQKGSKYPELRFKGFTDPWEQRKFGDLGSVAMCKRIFKEQTTATGEIPFYKIGTFGGEPDAFISRDLFEEYKAKFSYPEVGDMLISASGTIGRTVEYTGKDEYFQDSNIVWFKHDVRIDNSFLRCLYSIVEWSGIEGSTIKRLYNDNFLKTEFMLPCVAEQRKVGSFFSHLETLITLHQRKSEQEKQKKKALMQLLLTGKVRCL